MNRDVFELACIAAVDAGLMNYILGIAGDGPATTTNPRKHLSSFEAPNPKPHRLLDPSEMEKRPSTKKPKPETLR